MTSEQGRAVVVGVDFGTFGDDAIIEAIRLVSSGWASTLHAVHVLDPADVINDADKPAMATEEEVLAKAPAALHDRIGQLAAMLQLKMPVQSVQVHARLGKPADALLQVAVDYDADLIVVGTHGRKGVDRLILGSVAERLVRNATCPVFVARQKDHSKRAKSERPDPPYKAGEAPSYASGEDRPSHITTESPSWHPSDNGPTGFRIV